MHPVPERPIDNGLMLAGMGRALVHGHPDVNLVMKQLVEPGFVEGRALLGHGALRRHFPLQESDRSQGQEALEDAPDQDGIGLVDDEFAVLTPA